MSFINRAKEAYREEQEKQQALLTQEKRKLETATVELCGRVFGCVPESVIDDVVTIEGIQMRLWRDWQMDDGEFNARILGACPECGEAVESIVCYDLVTIGKQLTKIQPDYNHDCRPVNKPKVDMSALEMLLRDIGLEVAGTKVDVKWKI